MSNRTFLVGGNSADTPGITPEGGNYNPDTEILAAASYCLPILWCSLFKEDHVAYHEIEDLQIPTLVAKLPDSLQLLSSRIARINEAFPHYSQAISNWWKLVDEAPFEYIKVDFLELLMLDDTFEDRLRSGLKWYETGGDEDLQNLADLVEGSYDTEQKRLVIEGADFDDFFMHGYGWVREVPWESEDE